MKPKSISENWSGYHYDSNVQPFWNELSPELGADWSTTQYGLFSDGDTNWYGAMDLGDPS